MPEFNLLGAIAVLGTCATALVAFLKYLTSENRQTIKELRAQVRDLRYKLGEKSREARDLRIDRDYQENRATRYAVELVDVQRQLADAKSEIERLRAS